MIYIKWLGLAIIDILLLLCVASWLPIVYSLFTRDGWIGWFKWAETYDNPACGDGGFIAKRSPFPNELDGWKGYINRAVWMYRNPMYGYQKWVGIKYDARNGAIQSGTQRISDKYAIPGSYFNRVIGDMGKVIAFEYYLIKPYGKNKCIRIRLGWKITTDKFGTEWDFAPLVDTFSPFKQYGESVL